MREQSIGAPRVARPCIFQTGYVNYSRPPGLRHTFLVWLVLIALAVWVLAEQNLKVA
jgi:hypothetical protein